MNNSTTAPEASEPFRPTSRNTCPTPGCDEPRNADNFAECCDRHAEPARF